MISHGLLQPDGKIGEAERFARARLNGGLGVPLPWTVEGFTPIAEDQIVSAVNAMGARFIPKPGKDYVAVGFGAG